MTHARTKADWIAAAAALRPRNQLLIDGKWSAAASGLTFDSLSPRDGRVVTQVAAGDAVDIDRAVRSARAAFEDGRWSKLHPTKRGAVLQKWARLVAEHEEELMLLETVDVGKPIRYSGSVDVEYCHDALRYYGEACDKIYGEVAPTGTDAVGMIVREPLGVVGAVVPWNFPLMLTAWKLGPALATGNSVVLKPAEQSPLSSLRLAELALEAGVPPGVLNVVTGFGETAGKAIGLHPDIDAVTFTGSTGVGKLFLQYAGQSNMKRVSAETGGKSPDILFADAPDLEFAAKQAAFGVFFNTGAMCNAGSRLLVQESVKDRVVAIVDGMRSKLLPGDPLDPESRLGPVIDAGQMSRIEHFIALGQQQGARLVAGGRRVMAETGGHYIEPTIFDNVTNDMAIAQEEIFGPVVSVIPFKDESDALRIANDTKFGLAAAVWTSDLGRAHRLSREIRAGTVWVNNFDKAEFTVPFGGVKESGFGGKDKSLHAMDKYVNLKTIWINIGGRGSGGGR